MTNSGDKSNRNVARDFKVNRAKTLTVDQFVDGILAGNRTILSQAVTLVESSKPAHQILAQQVIERCLPHSGNSIRIGITGVPGVGKSTFIESFGIHLLEQGRKLAVLAIDPTSEKTRGSILGDKTRMEELSMRPEVFIRPSPSAGSLGGVARKTRESIILFEAAGFDTLFIETVGVGQSEIAVHSMVDFFLLLMLAGAGDELQGIKRGIMEMADAILITKSDGENVNASISAQREYKRALHLFPPTKTGWIPKVELTSAIEKEGMNKAWDIIQEHPRLLTGKALFEQNRQQQASFWMYETVHEQLRNQFYSNEAVKERIEEMEKAVIAGTLSPFAAAQQLLAISASSE
jgi:LAO/AO transport system kinase